MKRKKKGLVRRTTKRLQDRSKESLRGRASSSVAMPGPKEGEYGRSSAGCEADRKGPLLSEPLSKERPKEWKSGF